MTVPSKGRRTAAMLCVLLTHALLIGALHWDTASEPPRAAMPEPPALTWITLQPQVPPIEDATPPVPEITVPRVLPPPPSLPATDTSAQEVEADAAALAERYARIDWPIEAREAARRVLAAEAEAERIARMFAGPSGTWASLTRRQQSELSQFRWRPGVDGLERDENGNTIYRINDRCVLVNFMFIGCAIGAKPPAYGDLFKDMRLYFDEQRRPRTQEGNGTEPESRRPPKWSKPLRERDE